VEHGWATVVYHNAVASSYRLCDWQDSQTMSKVTLHKGDNETNKLKKNEHLEGNE